MGTDRTGQNQNERITVSGKTEAHLTLTAHVCVCAFSYVCDMYSSAYMYSMYPIYTYVHM